MRNAETNTGKAKPAITCSSPSAEAVALAVLLSGHTHCQKGLQGIGLSMVCDGCLGDAQTIDATLQLPQRNAALFRAQALVEEYDNGTTNWDMTPLDELREALARIRTPKP